MALTEISPNERPTFTYPGESASILLGRLKYSSPVSQVTPDPEPRLDPPEDKGEVCEACSGDGCDLCDFTGWINPPTEEDMGPDRADE